MRFLTTTLLAMSLSAPVAAIAQQNIQRLSEADYAEMLDAWAQQDRLCPPGFYKQSSPIPDVIYTEGRGIMIHGLCETANWEGDCRDIAEGCTVVTRTVDAKVIRWGFGEIIFEDAPGEIEQCVCPMSSKYAFERR